VAVVAAPVNSAVRVTGSAAISGVVASVRLSGARAEIVVRCGDVLVHAETPPAQSRAVGDRVAITLPPEALHVVAG
jgi:putative spermidine/putrescine transport system ATP-binding protein